MLTNFIFILGVIQIIDMDLEKATVFYKFSTFLWVQIFLLIVTIQLN